MKNALRYLLSLGFLLGAVALGQLFAQDTIIVPDPIGPGAGLQQFLDLYAHLEAAVIVILGYFHNWIPGLNRIPDKWFRIVLIGAVVVVIFTALGWQQGFGQILIFLQAVGFYEIILKKAGAVSPPIKK